MNGFKAQMNSSDLVLLRFSALPSVALASSFKRRQDGFPERGCVLSPSGLVTPVDVLRFTQLTSGAQL